jgi:YVTN family beta-propeller protein
LLLKPDGGELYIPSGDAHGLFVVNTQTNEVGDFRFLGMSPMAGALSADGATLYATDSAAGHVVPVAIGNRQVAHPITVGQSPVAAELTPGGDILAVVDTSSDDLAVIRTKTSSLITLIPTGPQPRSLAIKVF